MVKPVDEFSFVRFPECPAEEAPTSLASETSSECEEESSAVASSESTDGLELSSDDTCPVGEALLDATALTSTAARAARGEFDTMSLTARDSYRAYGDMTVENFAGPDDIRIDQISRGATQRSAAFVSELDDVVREVGISDVNVYGRGKSPISIYGKLAETEGMQLCQVRDLSGARIDIGPTQPGMTEYQAARSAAAARFGESMSLKHDYIADPNRWGYTGRIHDLVTEADGFTHELQTGGRGISELIDQDLTTAGGDRISVHDATGYKGDVYGARLPPHLEAEYTALMDDITRANRAGETLDDVPELQRRVDDFFRAAESSLPDTIDKPRPAIPEGAQRASRVARGFGVLGVAGGGVQLAQGVSEIQDGDAIVGTADVVGGTGNIVAGGATVAGRFAVGSTVGGAVAVVDGGRDIYVGVRDGDVEQGVVGTVKVGAGAAMIAGVATANPPLVVGGAIAYGGAVIYESRGAIYMAGAGAYAWATGE